MKVKVKVKVKENQQWQEHEAEQADWLVVSHRLVSVEVLARDHNPEGERRVNYA